MVLLLLAGPIAAASAAEFGIAPGGFAVRALDAAGNPEDRSGSHPDRLQIDFALETEGTGTSLRDLAIEMPAGLGGDLDAVPPCPRQAHEEGEECPPESQVGVVSFGSSGTPAPIFILEPEPGQLAAFTSTAGLAIPFEMDLRPDDFGMTISAEDLAEGAPSEGHIELWGVPANHQGGSGAATQPFLTLPSVCGSLPFMLKVRSREEGAEWLSESAEAGPLSGCEGLPFAPTLGLLLTNPLADSPTGVRIALGMPEEAEGSELASAQMKDVAIELPPGLTVSPGAAAGLSLCSDAQLGPNGSDAACPAAARVGTVAISSPLLPETLSGAVYFGEPRGAERFRLFVVAPGPGIVFKFVTALQPDPVTGRLTASFQNLPQVALTQIAMSLEGGAESLLAAPLGCGPASGEARFAPYGGGPAVVSTATVRIASVLPGLACPGLLPFAPRLSLTASSSRAGRASSFAAVLRRRGGEGLPARFSLTLPAGLSAALGAIDPCPEPLAASGSCPAASKVGTVRAEAGSGPHPLLLSGAAYLAGPYRRAPFSVVMALPARIGPFDFGTVAFRATTRIDERSGRVTVATDRLPSVVAGVPIRFQAISIGLDRPGLVHNPTSCGPHSLDGTLESQEGAVAALSSPYPVTGCKRLGFAPRLRASLASRGPLRRNSEVGLKVSARFRSGEAAMRSLSLGLPPALKLDIGGLGEICSRPDARRGLCPPGSKVGTSVARTSLLREPLRGSIYVVRPRGAGEPDLWVALSGGGVKLVIRGVSSGETGGFATKLTGLPDMPLSDFTMRLGGPGRGLLSFDASPCVGGRPRRVRAGLLLTAQNKARRSPQLAIATGARCGASDSR